MDIFTVGNLILGKYTLFNFSLGNLSLTQGNHTLDTIFDKNSECSA